MFALNDQVAVGLVDWRSEERGRQKLKKGRCIHSGFSRERQSFRQRFEHRGNQKIPGELDCVRQGWTLASHEQLRSHCLKEWPAHLDQSVRSGNDHGKPARFCRLGAPENWRCQITRPRFCMRGCKPIAQGYADGAERNVHRTARERLQNSTLAEHKTFQRRIIRNHRKQNCVPARLSHSCRDNRAVRAQRLGPLPRPVVHGDSVPGAQQTLRNSRAHPSKTDQASFHVRCLHIPTFRSECLRSGVPIAAFTSLRFRWIHGSPSMVHLLWVARPRRERARPLA